MKKKISLIDYFDEKQNDVLLNKFKIKSVKELLEFRDKTLNLSGLAKALGLEIKELVKKLKEIEK